MQEGARQLQPKKVSSGVQRRIQSLCFIYNDRVEAHLKKDPLTALLFMDACLMALLMAHYQLHQKWWISPHRLFSDLNNWDPELAQLVGHFVATGEVHTKFQRWSAIIAYILQPLSGKQPISVQNCMCSRCQNDLTMLLAKET